MRSPRQTATTGASNGTPFTASPNASSGLLEGSGPKDALPSEELYDAQGDEVFGDAHPGYRRREVVRGVVFPRLHDEVPQSLQQFLIGALRAAGACIPNARLGHAHHDLGASFGPHRVERIPLVTA